MGDTVLEVLQLTKQIKDKTLVEPIDFHVNSGKTLALCGGNGAGKSTIIRMIVGLLQPTAGQILIEKMDRAKQARKSAQSLGFMPDQFNFNGSLTALESLRFFSSLKRVSIDQTEEALDFVGLQEVKHQKVSTFSKGMTQRLLFAQALLGQPHLLVLDEPTNGLDPYWMKTFVSLLKRLKQNGQAVIFSTHQLDIAESVADEVLFLDAGKVISRGSVTEYQKKYGRHSLQQVFSQMF